MNIVFMGTPDFAKGVLESICESKNHKVVLVVTQPDKPKGRSGKMVESPVKEYALEQGIEVFQPVKIKDSEAVEKMRAYDADIFVVAAFGQILSKELLDMPKFGCINVHASLLPKYRGAAPIQWAIADGEKETGVTIMQMNEGLDTGDILTQVVVPIDDEETGESLFDKLMDAGSSLLVDTLSKIEQGEISRIVQDDSIATYAKILKKEMGCVDFTKSADEIEHLIRAFTPWPGGYTYYNNKMLKLKKVKASIEDIDGELGAIVKLTKDAIYVKCNDSVLRIDELQAEGKKSMSAHDFLLGNRLNLLDKLG